MGRKTTNCYPSNITTILQHKMNTILTLLTLTALVAAVPHNHDEQGDVQYTGPWEVVEDYQRVPKEVVQPASVLSKASSFWDWDREVVKKGIFENENIMIHVGQNLFNFIMTTLAWFTVSQIYSLTAQQSSTARQMPSYSLMDAADEVMTAIRNFEHTY